MIRSQEWSCCLFIASGLIQISSSRFKQTRLFRSAFQLRFWFYRSLCCVPFRLRVYSAQMFLRFWNFKNVLNVNLHSGYRDLHKSSCSINKDFFKTLLSSSRCILSTRVCKNDLCWLCLVWTLLSCCVSAIIYRSCLFWPLFYVGILVTLWFPRCWLFVELLLVKLLFVELL